jgi:hypothetical protein
LTSQNILSLVHKRRIIAERRHERKKCAGSPPVSRRKGTARTVRADAGGDP